MNLKIFSFICLTFGLSFAEEVIECNDENKAKSDLYLMEMSTFGDPNGKFATNQEELALQCKIDRQKNKWSTKYNDKCSQGITQDLLSIAMRDLERTINKYCDSPRLSKLLLSWADCGNQALNQTVKCWSDYVLEMERINAESDRIPHTDKMPLICCFYNKFDHCVEESFINKGETICSLQAASGLDSLLNEVNGNAVNLFCGEYTADSDKCDSVLMKYNHLNDIQITKPLSKSPLIPFINIVETAGIALDFKSINDRNS